MHGESDDFQNAAVASNVRRGARTDIRTHFADDVETGGPRPDPIGVELQEVVVDERDIQVLDVELQVTATSTSRGPKKVAAASARNNSAAFASGVLEVEPEEEPTTPERKSRGTMTMLPNAMSLYALVFTKRGASCIVFLSFAMLGVYVAVSVFGMARFLEYLEPTGTWIRDDPQGSVAESSRRIVDAVPVRWRRRDGEGTGASAVTAETQHDRTGGVQERGSSREAADEKQLRARPSKVESEDPGASQREPLSANRLSTTAPQEFESRSAPRPSLAGYNAQQQQLPPASRNILPAEQLQETTNPPHDIPLAARERIKALFERAQEDDQRSTAAPDGTAALDSNGHHQHQTGLDLSSALRSSDRRDRTAALRLLSQLGDSDLVAHHLPDLLATAGRLLRFDFDRKPPPANPATGRISAQQDELALAEDLVLHVLEDEGALKQLLGDREFRLESLAMRRVLDLADLGLAVGLLADANPRLRACGCELVHVMLLAEGGLRKRLLQPLLADRDAMVREAAARATSFAGRAEGSSTSSGQLVVPAKRDGGSDAPPRRALAGPTEREHRMEAHVTLDAEALRSGCDAAAPRRSAEAGRGGGSVIARMPDSSALLLLPSSTTSVAVPRRVDTAVVLRCFANVGEMTQGYFVETLQSVLAVVSPQANGGRKDPKQTLTAPVLMQPRDGSTILPLLGALEALARVHVVVPRISNFKSFDGLLAPIGGLRNALSALTSVFEYPASLFPVWEAVCKVLGAWARVGHKNDEPAESVAHLLLDDLRVLEKIKNEIRNKKLRGNDPPNKVAQERRLMLRRALGRCAAQISPSRNSEKETTMAARSDDPALSVLLQHNLPVAKKTPFLTLLLFLEHTLFLPTDYPLTDPAFSDALFTTARDQPVLRSLALQFLARHHLSGVQLSELLQRQPQIAFFVDRDSARDVFSFGKTALSTEQLSGLVLRAMHDETAVVRSLLSLTNTQQRYGGFLDDGIKNAGSRRDSAGSSSSLTLALMGAVVPRILDNYGRPRQVENAVHEVTRVRRSEISGVLTAAGEGGVDGVTTSGDTKMRKSLELLDMLLRLLEGLRGKVAASPEASPGAVTGVMSTLRNVCAETENNYGVVIQAVACASLDAGAKADVLARRRSVSSLAVTSRGAGGQQIGEIVESLLANADPVGALVSPESSSTLAGSPSTSSSRASAAAVYLREQLRVSRSANFYPLQKSTLRIPDDRRENTQWADLGRALRDWIASSQMTVDAVTASKNSGVPGQHAEAVMLSPVVGVPVGDANLVEAALLACVEAGARQPSSALLDACATTLSVSVGKSYQSLLAGSLSPYTDRLRTVSSSASSKSAHQVALPALRQVLRSAHPPSESKHIEKRFSDHALLTRVESASSPGRDHSPDDATAPLFSYYHNAAFSDEDEHSVETDESSSEAVAEEYRKSTQTWEQRLLATFWRSSTVEGVTSGENDQDQSAAESDPLLHPGRLSKAVYGTGVESKKAADALLRVVDGQLLVQLLDSVPVTAASVRRRAAKTAYAFGGVEFFRQKLRSSSHEKQFWVRNADLFLYVAQPEVATLLRSEADRLLAVLGAENASAPAADAEPDRQSKPSSAVAIVANTEVAKAADEIPEKMRQQEAVAWILSVLRKQVSEDEGRALANRLEPFLSRLEALESSFLAKEIVRCIGIFRPALLVPLFRRLNEKTATRTANTQLHFGEEDAVVASLRAESLRQLAVAVQALAGTEVVQADKETTPVLREYFTRDTVAGLLKQRSEQLLKVHGQRRKDENAWNKGQDSLFQMLLQEFRMLLALFAELVVAGFVEQKDVDALSGVFTGAGSTTAEPTAGQDGKVETGVGKFLFDTFVDPSTQAQDFVDEDFQTLRRFVARVLLRVSSHVKEIVYLFAVSPLERDESYSAVAAVPKNARAGGSGANTSSRVAADLEFAVVLDAVNDIDSWTLEQHVLRKLVLYRMFGSLALKTKQRRQETGANLQNEGQKQLRGLRILDELASARRDNVSPELQSELAAVLEKIALGPHRGGVGASGASIPPATRVLACRVLGRWSRGDGAILEIIRAENDEEVYYPCTLSLQHLSVETAGSLVGNLEAAPRATAMRIQTLQCSVRAFENAKEFSSPPASPSASPASLHLETVVTFAFGHPDPWVRQWGWQAVGRAIFAQTRRGVDLLQGFLLGGHAFWQTAKGKPEAAVAAGLALIRSCVNCAGDACAGCAQLDFGKIGKNLVENARQEKMVKLLACELFHRLKKLLPVPNTAESYLVPLTRDADHEVQRAAKGQLLPALTSAADDHDNSTNSAAFRAASVGAQAAILFRAGSHALSALDRRRLHFWLRVSGSAAR